MRISHFVVPNGGWEFETGNLKFKEDTFNELVKVVLEHQKSNNLPISSVIDIEDQIKSKHPELVIN